MAERTVAHALLNYQDSKGRRRMALRGAKVQLEGEELERAERIGAVVEGELDRPPVPAATAPRPPSEAPAASEVPDDEQPDTEATAAADESDAGEKPAEKPTRRSSTKG